MTSNTDAAHRILRRRDVERRLGISRSTLYAWISPNSRHHDASFPKPIHLGNGRAVGFIEAEIVDWIARQIEASRRASA